MAVKIARRFTGEIPFRKANIGAIVDRVEVEYVA